jgi:hypothetical protein
MIRTSKSLSGSSGPGKVSLARVLARTALAVDPGGFDAAAARFMTNNGSQTMWDAMFKPKTASTPATRVTQGNSIPIRGHR